MTEPSIDMSINVNDGDTMGEFRAAIETAVESCVENYVSEYMKAAFTGDYISESCEFTATSTTATAFKTIDLSDTNHHFGIARVANEVEIFFWWEDGEFKYRQVERLFNSSEVYDYGYLYTHTHSSYKYKVTGATFDDNKLTINLQHWTTSSTATYEMSFECQIW